jgi:hypothetical protein
MDEEEWWACEDPHKMLALLRSKVSERKVRMFAVACVRPAWGMLPRDAYRNAVEVAERFADGRATAEDLCNASAWCKAASGSDKREAVTIPSSDAADAAVVFAVWVSVTTLVDAWYAADYLSTSIRIAEDATFPGRETHCLILHDLFGNPFRPVSLDPAWLTPTVSSLAEAAYENRLLPSGSEPRSASTKSRTCGPNRAEAAVRSAASAFPTVAPSAAARGWSLTGLRDRGPATGSTAMRCRAVRPLNSSVASSTCSRGSARTSATWCWPSAARCPLCVKAAWWAAHES